SSIYSFSGGGDGGNPQDALLMGGDGLLYGTTFDGGDTDNGTVFKTTTNGFLTTVASLNVTNGDLPYAGVTAAADGDLYGTSYQGGASGRGTIFRVSSNGVLTTIYSFTGGTDGGFVRAGLTPGIDGALYGATFKGGTFNDGTIFRITTSGVFTSLFSFNGT